MIDGFKRDAEGYWKAVAPESYLDYADEFADWIPAGDSIASVVWSVPAGITASAPSHTTTKAIVWLSGFVLNNTYKISCKITTTAGRIIPRVFRLVCIEL